MCIVAEYNLFRVRSPSQLNHANICYYSEEYPVNTNS